MAHVKAHVPPPPCSNLESLYSPPNLRTVPYASLSHSRADEYRRRQDLHRPRRVPDAARPGRHGDFDGARRKVVMYIAGRGPIVPAHRQYLYYTTRGLARVQGVELVPVPNAHFTGSLAHRYSFAHSFALLPFLLLANPHISLFLLGPRPTLVRRSARPSPRRSILAICSRRG